MKNYRVQKSPFIVPTDDGKKIAEHFGLASDGNSDISIAHMIARPGWSEPYQKPEFTEYTFLISGKKQFKIEGETVILNAGESIKIDANTRVQYSNPFDQPCVYISVCTPAFNFNLVHRDAE
tara:strand:+ start:149330 stop:149695 length:366 start_codon:yes stop_codon:yes gene_type:complete